MLEKYSPGLHQRLDRVVYEVEALSAILDALIKLAKIQTTAVQLLTPLAAFFDHLAPSRTIGFGNNGEMYEITAKDCLAAAEFIQKYGPATATETGIIEQEK